MKIFVSSLIVGMERYRAAAREAIELLGHEPVMAEGFGAKASSSQIACLNAVRESDLIILILGERYGTEQASGISATHEEFREAKGSKPILTFVEDCSNDAKQSEFIREAGGWGSGLQRTQFASAEDLRKKVTKAIYDYALATVTSPLNPAELVGRARELIPQAARDSRTPVLRLAVAAGPRQALLRPAQIESPELLDAIEKNALFGQPPLFDRKLGTESKVRDGALRVFQGNHYEVSSQISVWETGDQLIEVGVDRSSRGATLPVVIEETIALNLEACVRQAAWILDKIDETERISHIALAASLEGSAAYGWRSQVEHAASPNSGSISMFGREDERSQLVMLTPTHQTRQALKMAAPRIVEDLLVLLRRRWKQD